MDMDKFISGMMLLAMLAAFSAPAMADCSCGPDEDCCSRGPATSCCGTNGTINGTLSVDGGEPCVDHFANLHVGTIPDGATIKWAHLYWHIWMPGNWTNVTFHNASGCSPLKTINLTGARANPPFTLPVCKQNESEGFYGNGGTTWVYWNVTDLVTVGDNTVTIDNRANGCDGRSMQCYMVAVYENESYPRTSYWVNPGYHDVATTTDFYALPSPANNTTSGTLWQLALCHNNPATIWFNGEFVAATDGYCPCGYGYLEQYEIPANWINATSNNTMEWQGGQPYYHPALAIFIDQPSMNNRGGRVRVRETLDMRQSKCYDATELHFKLWQKEDNIEVRDWDIVSPHFDVPIQCARGDQPPPHNVQVYNMSGLPTTDNPDNGMHAVDVNATAYEDDIGYNMPASFHTTFWLTDGNTRRISDINWTDEVSGDKVKAMPDHGWNIDYQTPDPQNPGQYNHTFTITNDDAVDTLNVSGLAFNATMDWYDSLRDDTPTSISYPDPVNFTLAPTASKSINISTLGPFIGGHIYFKYSINGSFLFGADREVLTAYVDHPVVSTKITVLRNRDFDSLVDAGRATKVGDTYYIKDQTLTDIEGDGITIENTDVPFVIDNCTIYDCASGVFMNNVTGGTVTGCTIRDNRDHGIELGRVPLNFTEDPKLTNITDNTIYENGLEGVLLIGFNYTVCGNTIRDNGEYGIYVFGNDSKICNNTIVNSTDYGMKVYNGSDNLIFWNNFTNNNDGGVQGYDGWRGLTGLALNIWNCMDSKYCYNGTGNYTGNYWDNHTLPDADDDGIVDTPYALGGDAGAEDSYPLIMAWVNRLDQRLCGNVNCVDDVNPGDVTRLRNNVTWGGEWPGMYPLDCRWAGDVNCVDDVNPGDVTRLRNNVTWGGEWPGMYPLECCEGCCPP